MCNIDGKEVSPGSAEHYRLSLKGCPIEHRTSEQVMVDMIRADLGVVIDPQAWRMFIRHRFERLAPLVHRIHDGKR